MIFYKTLKNFFSNLFNIWEKCVSLNCGNFCRVPIRSIENLTYSFGFVYFSADLDGLPHTSLIQIFLHMPSVFLQTFTKTSLELSHNFESTPVHWFEIVLKYSYIFKFPQNFSHPLHKLFQNLFKVVSRGECGKLLINSWNNNYFSMLFSKIHYNTRQNSIMKYCVHYFTRLNCRK